MNNIENRDTDRFSKKNKPIHDQKTREMRINESASIYPNKWLQIGIDKLKRHEVEEAISLFQKVLRVEPANAVANEKLAIANSMLANLKNTKELLSTGLQFMEQENWEAAKEAFEALLEVDPDHQEARTFLEEIISRLARSQSLSSDSPIFDFTDDIAIDQTPGVESSYTSPIKSGVDPDLTLPNVDISTDDFAREFECNAEDNTPQIDEVLARATAAFNIDSAAPTESPPANTPDYDIEFQKKFEDVISLYENGHLEKARAELYRLKEKYPSHAQIAYYLDIINRHMKGSPKAQNQIQIERLFKQGMDELEKDHFGNAEKCFLEALSIKPDFHQAQLMLEKIQTLKTAKKNQGGAKPKPEPPPKKNPQPARTSSQQKPPSAPAQRPMLSLGVIAGTIIIGALFYIFFLKYPEFKIASHLEKANQFILNGEFQDALTELDIVSTIDDSNAQLWELRGVVYLKMKNGTESVAAFDKARTLAGANISSRFIFNSGEAFLLTENFAAAEKAFRAVSEDPEYAKDANFYLGTCLARMNQAESAVSAFRKSSYLNPDDAKIYFEIGRLLVETEKFKEAEDEFLKTISLDPSFVPVYEALGDLYLKTNRNQDAIDIIYQPLEWLKPSDPALGKIIANLKYKLGLALYRNTDYDKAIDQFNQILLLEQSARVYIELGRTYYQTDKLQQALISWQRAVELEPENADIHFYLGRAYQKLGDKKKAMEAYQNATQKNPNHVQSITNLGTIYYELFDYQKARAMWEKSLKINPNQPIIKKKISELISKTSPS